MESDTHTHRAHRDRVELGHPHHPLCAQQQSDRGSRFCRGRARLFNHNAGRVKLKRRGARKLREGEAFEPRRDHLITVRIIDRADLLVPEGQRDL